MNSGFDPIFKLIVGAVGLLALVGVVLHIGVWSAAVLVGSPAPDLAATGEALKSSPLDPVAGYSDPPPAWLAYTLSGLVLVAIVAVVVAIVRSVMRRRHRETTGQTGSEDLKGASHRSAVKLARAITPVADVPEADLTIPLGKIDGKVIEGQHEDSFLVIAPARSGKTASLVAPWIADAPGPCLATGTKSDIVYLTAAARDQRGFVATFDLGDVSAWPWKLRWNPVDGCADPDEAIDRGMALAAGARTEKSNASVEFFTDNAGSLLGYYLHAAAIKPDGSMRDVLRWAMDFHDEEPYRLLLESETATAMGWPDAIKSLTDSGSPQTEGSLRMTVSQALKPMRSPRVLNQLCLPRDEGTFNVREFLKSSGTLFILSDIDGRSNFAPLNTMLTDYVIREAKRYSQSQPGGRLWPPLRLVLDEAANIAPLPGLPSIMSDSGGRGITPMVICQSFAQMDTAWGQEGARAVRANATAQFFLPGIKEPEELEKISKLTRKYRAQRVSTSIGASGSSTSVSSEWDHAMHPDKIREMPLGQALLFYRAYPYALVTMPPWWKRPDADRFREGIRRYEELTGRSVAHG